MTETDFSHLSKSMEGMIMSQMSGSLAAAGANVKTYGMQVNDNGAASSVESLIQKINDMMLAERSDQVQTDEEKLVGQNMDYSI